MRKYSEFIQKNIAILIGLIPIAIIWHGTDGAQYLVDRYPQFFACSRVVDFGCQSYSLGGDIHLALVPLVLTLPVSLMAYFLPREVHAFWFKWMMLVYSPIAFLSTLWIGVHFSSAPRGYAHTSGTGSALAVVLFCLVFYIISLIMVATKYHSVESRTLDKSPIK